LSHPFCSGVINKKDNISLVWAAFWIVNILLTGGGYYPFYFGGISLVMILAVLFFSKGNWKHVFLRTLYAFLLTVGLAAVMLVPMIDGFRLINREGGLDVDQKGSQPISYALLNYVISTPEWFDTSILGTTGGWNWFYIGSLSLAGWIFLPMAVKNRRSKNTTLTLIAITLFLLLWVANKYTFFNGLYEFIPILKSLRFPNRLLVLAVIPILIISGLSWQSTFVKLKRATRKMSMGLRSSSPKLTINIRFATLLSIFFLLFTWISVQDVYQINKGFSFAPRPLDQNASETLVWLKNYDDSIYYTWIGEFGPYWNWLPAAYQNELPVINFVYSQKLNDRNRQYDASSPFNAQPKYQVVSMAVPAPEGSVLVHANSGAGIYLYPDSLPFSFSTTTQNIESLTLLNNKNVSGVPAKFDGPNRIVAQAASSKEEETLVILVSDYPGWKVFVDGKEGQYRPVNGYLSTPLKLGNHSYMFVFDPMSHKIGLTISLISIIFSIALVLSDITKKLIEKSAPVVEQIAG